MGYFLKLDQLTRKPRVLLRTRDFTVERWDGKTWQEIPTTTAQIAGLGGDSDYYSIRPADLKTWQKKLPPE